MVKIQTHYENLKVARNAPPEVIRAAYHSLAKKYHPDKNQGNSDANRIMALLNVAYDILYDPEKRREHDQWIAVQEARNKAQHNSPSSSHDTTDKTEPSKTSAPKQPPKQSEEEAKVNYYSIHRNPYLKTKSKWWSKFKSILIGSLSIIYLIIITAGALFSIVEWIGTTAKVTPATEAYIKEPTKAVASENTRNPIISTKKINSDSNNLSHARTYSMPKEKKERTICKYKPVMTDADYFACGTHPPQTN